jgi:tetratricopeptide (TPR) repeat protein
LSASFTQYEGLVEILAGNLARAEERLKFGLERLEEMGERAFVSSLAALMAEVLYKQGRHDEARRFVDRSQETAAPDDLGTQIAWLTVRARILAATGHLEDAEADALRAVSLAEGTDWSTHHAAACVALAEALYELGRLQDAELAIRTSLTLYEKKGNSVAAEEARALLSGLVPA